MNTHAHTHTHSVGNEDQGRRRVQTGFVVTVVCFQTEFLRCFLPQRCERWILILPFGTNLFGSRDRARRALRGPEGHTAERLHSCSIGITALQLPSCSSLVSAMDRRRQGRGSAFFASVARIWRKETMQEVRKLRRKAAVTEDVANTRAWTAAVVHPVDCGETKGMQEGQRSRTIRPKACSEVLIKLSKTPTTDTVQKGVNVSCEAPPAWLRSLGRNSAGHSCNSGEGTWNCLKKQRRHSESGGNRMLWASTWRSHVAECTDQRSCRRHCISRFS